jgi:hypothetical protein
MTDAAKAHLDGLLQLSDEDRSEVMDQIWRSLHDERTRRGEILVEAIEEWQRQWQAWLEAKPPAR